MKGIWEMGNIVFKNRDYSEEDIHEIVSIHHRQIGTGFLSSLGENVLDLVFKNMAESRHSFLISAIDEDTKKICGFICGTIDVGKLYRDFFFSKFFKAVFYVLPKLMSLDAIRKVIETLSYPGGKDHQELPVPEFLDFALEPEYQGSGLAQKLFYAAVRQYKEWGVKEFKSAVNEILIASQKFHEKMGGRKAATIQVHKGQDNFVYVFDVDGVLAAQKHA